MRNVGTCGMMDCEGRCSRAFAGEQKQWPQMPLYRSGLQRPSDEKG